MKLTKTAIDAMKFEGQMPTSKDLRWDSEVPGFGVRVYPNGSKSYFVIYRHHGREKSMALGRCTVVTLQQARDHARAVKVKAAAGKDPLGERKRRNEGTTFGELAQAYIERHAAKKRAGRNDESMLRNHILPVWKNLALETIQRSDVAYLHHRLSAKKPPKLDDVEKVGAKWKTGRTTGGPVVANRAVALLSKMFNLAKAWGFVPANAANPAEGIERNKEVERERFCSPQEVRLLAARIEKEDNIFLKAAIWGYLLIGARKSTLLKLEWANIDPVAKTVKFTETKKGKPFVMPLTSAFEQLLEALPKVAKNPYVFVGRRKGKHLVALNKNWEKIRADCGLRDVRIHDLRHTVVTWLANSGYSFALIGKAVDQSNERTTKRYAHLQLKPAAQVLESHGKRLQAVIEAKSPDEIEAAMAATPKAKRRMLRGHRTVVRRRARPQDPPSPPAPSSSAAGDDAESR